jgi:hypothetical protein
MFNLVAKNVRNGNGSYRAMVLNRITSNQKLIKYKENFIAIDENPHLVKILDEIKKNKNYWTINTNDQRLVIKITSMTLELKKNKSLRY